MAQGIVRVPAGKGWYTQRGQLRFYWKDCVQNVGRLRKEGMVKCLGLREQLPPPAWRVKGANSEPAETGSSQRGVGFCRGTDLCQPASARGDLGKQLHFLRPWVSPCLHWPSLVGIKRQRVLCMSSRKEPWSITQHMEQVQMRGGCVCRGKWRTLSFSFSKIVTHWGSQGSDLIRHILETHPEPVLSWWQLPIMLTCTQFKGSN